VVARAQPLESLGRYEVLGVLATGGMAEVLLARVNGPSGFERPVVIKRILPHLARERVFRDMFLEESKIVARIRHRNVVAVHELGEEAQELYLVMEYLEGESLAAIQRRLRMRKEKLPVHIAAYITAEACAGLHAAHEQLDQNGRPLGVVHRDLSPHNVFVLYDGQVKVIDFGIAKTAESTAKTQTGQIKGKFAYMAPEQVRAEPLDRRTDVFALGIVLWETATGERLFEREHDLLVFKALCEDPIPKASSKREGFPPEIEEICDRALRRSPHERYETALEMRKALLTATRNRGEQSPEDELGAIVVDLFDERFAKKRDLLARIQRGANVATVAFMDDSFPSGGALQLARPLQSSRRDHEVTQQQETPPISAASDMGTNGALLATNSGAEPRRRSIFFYAVPALVAVVVGGLAALGMREPPPVAPAAATAAPQIPAAKKITVNLATNPAGARVRVNGVEKGVTPIDLAFDPSETEIVVEIEKNGYKLEREKLVPSVDQKLTISLAVEAPASASAVASATAAAPPPALPRGGVVVRPPPTSTGKPTATAAPGFQRFD